MLATYLKTRSGKRKVNLKTVERNPPLLTVIVSEVSFEGVPACTPQRIGDTVYFTDSRGVPAGSATTIGSTTYFTGADGIPAGSASTSGSSGFYR